MSSSVEAVSIGTDFLADVIDGLSRQQKALPCKYFYDEKGSQLFEKICETPEYYITRTECLIYESYAGEMADYIGERALILEPGAGSVKKIALLLEKLQNPAGFIPLDISEEILQQSSDALSEAFPELDINPVVMDFMEAQQLQRVFSQLPSRPLVHKRVVFFPGSTIGNFNPVDAQQFLQRFADNLQTGDGLLIGVDLVKDVDLLEDAYNDTAGVTADFNLNLLHRINEELDADFELEAFEHRAVFNAEHSRIEMHIVSSECQTVAISDQEFCFNKEETIHTENSYKYSVKQFEDLARRAGFLLQKTWIDQKGLFSVHYLEKSAD